MTKKITKTIYLFDEHEYPTFKINIEETEPQYKKVSCSFIVYKIESWNEEKKPQDMEQYLHGSIKWDSCSHIWFGDGGSGYEHLCGVTSYKQHIDLLSYLYTMAFKEMGIQPDAGEEWQHESELLKQAISVKPEDDRE